MQFIGREKELKVINQLLERKGYQGCLIYGRRRLGKTELVRHALSNKNIPTIIYQCKESSEKDNVLMLEKIINEVLNLEYQVRFDDFIQAIEFLFKYSINNELYLVLDEYPYIRELINGCDSKIQAIIDKYQNESNIKFFLLGSSISIMKEIQYSDNPLYLRFNNSILLKQMNYYDSFKFYPSFSNEDKIRLYSAFGGVPFYNAQINEKLSVKENIINILSGSFSSLKDFLEIYLKSELRKVNSANSVFESIALGAYHFKDILSKSHIESSVSLSNILQKLIEMGLIEYVYPINNKKNKQKGGYKISDHSIKFYYNFIYRNESAHKILDDNKFYDIFINEEFESSFVPFTFEEIAKEYLIKENNLGNINPLLINIGTYWYDNKIEKTNGEFDIVGESMNGYIFFECKYRNKKIDDKMIEEEIAQVNKTYLKPIQYGFFSKSGYSLSKNYDYLFFTLDDLYK